MRGKSEEEMKQNGISLHPLDVAAGPEPELLCIFGTGDLGRSLGLRLLQSGYGVVYGSRKPHSCGPLPQGAQVMTHAEAAQSSNLIFICVHREHYEFLTTMEHHLKGKVNKHKPTINNLKKGMYPEANAKNKNISGFYLNCVQVFLCGESGEAKQAVAHLATKLGLTVMDIGSLSAARELEDFPLKLFPEWRLPLSIAVGLTVFFFFYLLIRDVIYAYVEKKDEISYRIMVSLTSKVFPIVALGMLSLCYLPGAIAAFFQLYRGTKYRRFPNWLDRWMLCRKQMGLVALGFAFLHAIYTFIIPIRYSVRHKLISGVMKNNKTTPFYFDNTNAWRMDSFLSLGILGFFLFVLLGLTSLPSVGGSLSWRELNFIQSKLGHLTLFVCTAHGYIYGWNRFLRPSTYKWYTPPGYVLCLIVPSVVLVLKLLLLLPCVDRGKTRCFCLLPGWLPGWLPASSPGQRSV
uniref:STEAP family member 4 n=1 Tax=Poecilia reticulata TaxID=8081 RepID=A0A3P9Q4S1_POERE